VSEGKFSKCEEGEKCLSIEFRVFGKKMEEKKKVFFWEKVSRWNFAKFESLVRLNVSLQVTKKSFRCGLPR
jgi:hypothetical protein